MWDLFDRPISATSSIVIVILFSVAIVEGILLYQHWGTTRVVTQPSASRAQTGANDEASQKAKSTTTPNVQERTFSYPYPVTWSQGSGVLEFSITGVRVGEVEVPERFFRSDSPAYAVSAASGESVNALVFHLKARNTSKENRVQPPELLMRRIQNEEGDNYVPNTTQFDPTLLTLAPNTSYTDQRVIFVVPEDQDTFTFTADGTTDTYFTVHLSAGQLRIEQTPHEG